MTHAGQLGPLFPKSGSQTRPEPFKIERTFQDKAPVNFETYVLGITEKAKQESDDARWAKKGAGKKKKKIGDRAPWWPPTLRRKVEEAERRLEFDAVCDPTEALDQSIGQGV
ncbi:hypothetical protein DFH09DRAFT_1082469 [Mycena vulgaris]|nr:hypothetical protein DFH09DRAFT_1082469 [Mycena vulgaris]